MLAIGSATIVMLVSAVISWIVVRTKIPGRWLLDNLASLPLVFPGLVLGLAIMVCYLTSTSASTARSGSCSSPM